MIVILFLFLSSMSAWNFSSTVTVRTTPEVAYRELIDYTWKRGGELPISPSPVIVEEGTPDGAGCHRVIPPLNIREEILEVAPPSSITYRVANPGWLRAYPVVKNSHRGQISFTSNPDGSTTILWNVKWVALTGGEVRILGEVVTHTTA